MTTTGVTRVRTLEALECALHYARAGRVPTGRTLDELEAIQRRREGQ